MLVWGSKGGVADLGPQGTKHCAVCERERSFRLLLQYKVSHFWYVLKWVSAKQYAMVCEVCQRGDKLDTQAVEAKLGKPKIPTTSSRAWMAVVAVFAGLVIFGAVNNTRESEQTDAWLAAPHKSDLYLVNVASLLKEPQSLGMYGVLRVRSVDVDQLVFDAPAVAYETVARARKDLTSGRPIDAGYFTSEPLVLSRRALADMRKNGSLRQIERPVPLDFTGASQPGH